MEIIQLTKKVDIDWTNIEISLGVPPVAHLENYSFGFEISPRDFLSFAQQNLKMNDKKGLISALSNAKRAIDCQIDLVILFYGFNYSKFEKANCYSQIKSLINEYEIENQKFSGVPFKLKFITSFGIAPSFLVSKIRELRNKLEHEYKMPSKAEVREAVEVAELFINSTENIITRNFYHSIFFGNNLYIDDSYNKPFFKISYPEDNKDNKILKQKYNEFKITLFKNKETYISKISPKNKKYIFLIKVLLGEFSYLVDVFDIDMERKYFNYKLIQK